MGNSYSVTTMGRLGNVVPFPESDDEESGMLNQAFTMVGIDDGPAASEGGESDTREGASVGTASANQIPEGTDDSNFFATLPDGARAIFDALTDEAKREFLTSAAKARQILAAFTSTPKAPIQHTGGGTGGGRAGGGIVPGGGGSSLPVAGLFGDLFGEHTDTVVIAGALLALGGLAYVYFKHHGGTPAARPMARRRAR